MGNSGQSSEDHNADRNRESKARLVRFQIRTGNLLVVIDVMHITFWQNFFYILPMSGDSGRLILREVD